MSISLLTVSVIFCGLLLLVRPAEAKGFTDLATCFTARKGDNNSINDLGECRLHFYSSYGGGTDIHMVINGRYRIDGQCPGASANFGLTGCVVNGLPGEIRTVGSEDYPAFCAWRHKDSIAYCARPWNHRGI